MPNAINNVGSPTVKKGGAGKHNWGSSLEIDPEEIREAEIAAGMQK